VRRGPGVGLGANCSYRRTGQTARHGAHLGRPLGADKGGEHRDADADADAVRSLGQLSQIVGEGQLGAGFDEGVLGSGHSGEGSMLVQLR
jgi:hypothetical protein